MSSYGYLPQSLVSSQEADRPEVSPSTLQEAVPPTVEVARITQQ